MALSSFWKSLGPLLRPSQQPQISPPVRQPAPTVVQPKPAPQEVGGTVMAKISQAANSRVQLFIRYKGKPRTVEPYSYRGGDLMGYCSLHLKIHRFKLSRIEAIEITDIGFTPRWDIEIV